MRNRVCEILNIEKPIVQGPMVWIANAEVVAAVCESGGLGTLGVNAGYNTRVTSIEETAERFRSEIRKTKSLTDKPFAFNFMLADELDVFSKACLQVAIEEGMTHVVAGGDASAKAVKRLKDNGFIVIARQAHPSIEGAKILEEAGADVIVATGFDEGGSAPGNPIGTMSIVPIISDAVNIPVLAAGGIVDARGVKASLALGAEGVFVGTAFITSKESPCADITKEVILKYDSTDTLTIKTASGHERCLPTKPAIEAFSNQTSDDVNAHVERVTQTFLDGFIKGELDKGFISVNASISLIKEIKPVSAIIDNLFKDVSF